MRRYKKSGDKIRELISVCNLTQKEAADYWGVTLRTVQNWCQGVCPANQALVWELCSVFEMDYFYYGESSLAPEGFFGMREKIGRKKALRSALF